ncbi:uncharacterized protein DSM5745_08539 [Aspergillus mulundensis]|uniref:Uncharacterized protein n=1 Tax=Aspergillus mulundensis TaxID=1810919 RepID=A0A3D8R436_9EURO|nr:hypothetical protein DSM5745_08539 [Aspergillus mulundensis]RDW68779.1 hypothetical protein DSM5745_08539 [Aspergillus mulundensis]
MRRLLDQNDEADSNVPLAKRNRDPSRPYNQFMYQLETQRRRYDDLDSPDRPESTAPGVNTRAYKQVRNQWEESEQWNPKWGVLPGPSWNHEIPFDEWLSDKFKEQDEKDRINREYALKQSASLRTFQQRELDAHKDGFRQNPQESAGGAADAPSRLAGVYPDPLPLPESAGYKATVPIPAGSKYRGWGIFGGKPTVDGDQDSGTSSASSPSSNSGSAVSAGSEYADTSPSTDCKVDNTGPEPLERTVPAKRGHPDGSESGSPPVRRSARLRNQNRQLNSKNA